MSHAVLDYAAVGFRCGLEVHQQLLTERKLFCRCPAGHYTREHDGTVLRHMRPTLSELGEYDGTALMEFKTRKNIIYLLHRSNVCTYEMDDTPPFLMNQQALDIAIEQCLMLGCDIVDEVHIARKQYLDGSIPTGFQRTAIVGVNGSIPFRDRSLRIIQVSVEEDSCREVSDRGHLIVWRTDRLGMPLTETVTAPELLTPDEVEEAILLIGRVCRSTGHVRTGLGASRQDVNVSVRGGSRVEIKGVPQAGWAPALVHGEAVRQVNLLRLRDELHRRGFTAPDTIRTESFEVTNLFDGSALRIVQPAAFQEFRERDLRRVGFELTSDSFQVQAVRLCGLAGTLTWPGQPDLDFSHEIAGRLRVIACLDQHPNLLHSEKWPDYQGSQREFRMLRAATGCGPEDALIIVWGTQEDTLCAAQEIHARYADATVGVPPETRQPFSDGSTQFERVLPGPDRMYPDTDSPPQVVERRHVAARRAALPPPPWVRQQRYQAAQVPVPVIHYLIRRGGARLVDLVSDGRPPLVREACFFFGEKLKGLQRNGLDTSRITDPQWRLLFDALLGSLAAADAWQHLVSDLARNPEATVQQIMEHWQIDQQPDQWREEVRAQVRRVMEWECRVAQRPQLVHFLMGQAMAQLRGRVPARQVLSEIIAVLEGQR